MSSICNFINKRKIVEDFIQVNPMCISNCIILLMPSKNDNKKIMINMGLDSII